jgi:hypothetical protein
VSKPATPSPTTAGQCSTSAFGFPVAIGGFGTAAVEVVGSSGAVGANTDNVGVSSIL